MADARHYNYTRVMIRAYVPIKKKERERRRRRRREKGLFLSFLIYIDDRLYLYNARTYHAVARLKIPHLSGFFFFRFPPPLPPSSLPARYRGIPTRHVCNRRRIFFISRDPLPTNPSPGALRYYLSRILPARPIPGQINHLFVIDRVTL